MAANAFLSWFVREQPWELEDELIAKLDLPLNLKGNHRNPFHSMPTQERTRYLAEALVGVARAEGSQSGPLSRTRRKRNDEQGGLL